MLEQDLHELDEIREMLKKEGKSDGECSYLVIVATQLYFIETSLHRIGLILFIALLFIVGKILLSPL